MGAKYPDALKLDAKPAKRRNETRELTTPIRAALNGLEGVRVVRNTDRGKMVPYHLRFDPNPPVILTGLGEGSCDLVGEVTLRVYVLSDGQIGVPLDQEVAIIGRAFALEVKWKDGNTDPRRAKVQALWRRAFRRFGGFACVVRAVDADDGIAQAIAAVARCRAGASE